MLARAALGGIWIYQRFVSPYKGFRCAHAVLHGGTGCSGFAKETIRQHGFFDAIPVIRQRFRDCREAFVTLSAGRSEDGNAPRQTKPGKCARQMRDGCCDAAISESCNSASSSIGRGATRSASDCAGNCDFCSCG